MSLVLITGVAGFLGRHLAAQLQARGDAVRGLDLAPLDPDASAIDWRRGSIASEADLRNAMAGVDAVIHAAALTDLWNARPARYDQVNAEGTRLVLAEAARAGVARAVHVSSYVTLIAGQRADPGAPLTETAEHPPDRLIGAYARSKRRAELLAQRAAEDGLSVSIVQPSAPIGPGDRRPTPPGRLLRDLSDGKLPAYLDCLINLVDIRAVAAGVLAALDQGAPGRRYLLSGEDLEMADLARRVCAISGARPPRFAAPAPLALTAAQVETGLAGLTGRAPNGPIDGVRLALRRRRFSAARARRELGYAPGPIDQAIRDALTWLREERAEGRERPDAASGPTAERPA